MNRSTIIMKFTYNCNEHMVSLNSSNVSKIDKCLKKGTINEALKSWKKFNIEIDNKKSEINVKTLNSMLNDLDISYNLIGKYLINLKFVDKNYIIDFVNGSIEVCNFIDSFDNTKKETKINDSDSSEENDNIINKIEEINKSIPNDFQSLIKFSVENSEMIKPVLSILNSKTNNFLGDLIEKIGLDLNLKEKVNSNDEVTKISKFLKIIEELNNSDISNLKSSEGEKFNFILSEIWNQIKKILLSLNKLSPSDNYDTMALKYQESLKTIGYSEKLDNICMDQIIKSFLNDSLSRILNSYYRIIDSKYLELNILLQGFNSTKSDIIDNKINSIMGYNYNLFTSYFNSLYSMEDLFNIFSNFNKNIKFNQVLNSLNSQSKNYLILKINEFSKNNHMINLVDVKLNLDMKEFGESFEFDFNVNSSDNIIDNYYNKYANVINLAVNDKQTFDKKITDLYNETIFIKKKKDLSSLLVKLHEELKFKLSIITKIN